LDEFFMGTDTSFLKLCFLPGGGIKLSIILRICKRQNLKRVNHVLEFQAVDFWRGGQVVFFFVVMESSKGKLKRQEISDFFFKAEIYLP